MDDVRLITVVETSEFLTVTRKLFSEKERADLVDYLARNPEAGDLIQGTGGVRKLRWRLDGRGKSGGARIIYFYYNGTLPLFALSAYAKNERSDLSQADRNKFRNRTLLLVDTYAPQDPKQ